MNSLRSASSEKLKKKKKLLSNKSKFAPAPKATDIVLILPSLSPNPKRRRGEPRKVPNSPQGGRLYTPPSAASDGPSTSRCNIVDAPKSQAEIFFSKIDQDEKKYSFFNSVNPHGDGKCFIIVNFENDLLPHGITKDITELEAFYGRELRYKVLGGPNCPFKDTYRDVDMSKFKQIINSINCEYDSHLIDATRNSPFDRIIIHFFSVGNRDDMLMPNDGEMVRKVDMLGCVDQRISNLKKIVPVVFFMHTATSDLLASSHLNAVSPTGESIKSPNLLAVFSISQSLQNRPWSNPSENGSWIIQRFVHKLKQLYSQKDICEILRHVNEEASRNRHPLYFSMENGFKLFYL